MTPVNALYHPQILSFPISAVFYYFATGEWIDLFTQARRFGWSLGLRFYGCLGLNLGGSIGSRAGRETVTSGV